jgi:luciferase-like monooxygenase
MGIATRIEEAVTSWEGVAAYEHRFGGREFRYGRRELGHLHGDTLADLPFPKRITAMLVETGRAEPHRFARGGWVSFPIRNEEDVDAAVELFRLSYERARVAAARSAASGAGRSSPRSPRTSSEG